MTLEEALIAMKDGKEVTHEYLRHTETQSLRIIGEYFVDKDGYALNNISVYMTLKHSGFNDGWEIVENND